MTIKVKEFEKKLQVLFKKMLKFVEILKNTPLHLETIQ